MKKEDIVDKKEKETNIEMAYIFVLLISFLIVLIALEMLGIFILPKRKAITCAILIILIAIIPVYMVLVKKINESWVKYVLVVSISLISAIGFAVFTFHMVILLVLPIMVASSYNNRRLLYITTILNIITMFIAHVVAPMVTVNNNEPLYNIQKSVLFGFVPRIFFLIGIAAVMYFNIRRYNSTITNMIEYGEDLEKSTNGLKRIFIECHEMLHTDNNDTFLRSVGGALFRIVKFLKGSRENVDCIIVLKNENEQYIAIDELYERQDESVKEDDTFVYINYKGNEYKIVKINECNEGNVVNKGDSSIMTFYDKDVLVGFIMIRTTLDMEVSANKTTMNVLYNSIKLCISTKQAENLMYEAQEQLIYAFSQISESKSKETGQHIRRVSEYMREFGKSICKTAKECDDLACASMLHDVGKLIVPSAVLDKPGKLTPEEFDIIKEHTKYGGELLEHVPGEMMNMARNIAMQHHERWDGKGYNGLKGEEINFYARYVSVIDVFDALISKRCYKSAWTLEDAYNEIVKNSGTQFAPEAVDLFIEKYDALVEIYNKYPDEA